MTRWLRILVLTILVPAYGIAAAGVTMFAAGVAHAQHLLVDGQPADPSALPALPPPAADDDEHAAEVAKLLFEHGDTSDDVPDHCKPEPARVRSSAPQLPPLAAPLLHEPQRTPQPLLRPPRG